MPFIAYAPIYAHPLPAGHRFPMLKYELIPAQLLHEGAITPGAIFAPGLIPEEYILWTHTEDYWRRMKTLRLTDREMRAIGFPLSAELVEREQRITQGTIDCALAALRTRKAALNVAGGTHHAFADHGEGFCLLNDFAIAANYLLRKNLARKILILDLDVHQGNGTAALFAHQPRVFTCSFHGSHNYPFHKEASSLDVPLPDGTSGPAYLALLTETLAQIIPQTNPDIIFYLAGADVLSTDKFGKLSLSLQDAQTRDQLVFRAAKAAGIPVAVSMGGGYSPDIRHIVNAHANTFKAALDIFGL